jgi:hypothetical protein
VHFADTTRTDLEGGIMVRASLDKDAPYVALTRNRSSGWFVRYRVARGGGVISAGIASGTPLDYVNFAVRRVGTIVSLYAQTRAGEMRKVADCPVIFAEDEAFVGYVAWGTSAAAPGVLGFTTGILNQDTESGGMPDDSSLATFDSVKWMNEWDGLAAPDSLSATTTRTPALSELTGAGASVNLVAKIAGVENYSKSGPWFMDTGFSRAAIAQERRGGLTWAVSTAADGMFLLELSLQEALAGKETPSAFRIKFFVDGQYLGTRTITPPTGGVAASGLWFTPWLKKGIHTLHAFWDGSRTEPRLRINSVSLHAIQGIDEDGNGVADWIDRRLHTFNSVDVAADENGVVTSPVSPLPLEGRARWPGLVKLDTRSRGRNRGGECIAGRGLSLVCRGAAGPG